MNPDIRDIPTCPGAVIPHPIGVEPRWLHREKRAWAIMAAIGRFTEESCWPEVEWVEELAELLSEIKAHRGGAPF
jgi:hypothetical protein